MICQDAVTEVVQSLHPLAEEKGLDLVPDMPEHPITILTDHRALNQILLNLTNNAIKFTNKGSIRLSVSILGSGERHVAIRVKDTGIGIKQEDQKLIFDAFQQIQSTDGQQSEGSGLGLHVSQKFG